MHDEPEIEMVAMLSASLALVKPAGMTSKEAEDWLDAAFDALAHLPLHIFRDGIRAARLTCDHPSKIVPAVVAATKDALAWHNRPKHPPVLRLVAPEGPAHHEPLPHPDTLMPSLKRIGLKEGWIVDGPNGLEWSQEKSA
ncbi:hypothetical protein EDF56_101163 [Novosphingobium sp. PhB165]|uniref:hypothetical protein n=1 Tax=Novosphingobium sp. PhB165 TaxID=2485105 RepID=UPI00104ED646|nr:hypothetical protein [Novosphingobium sp. PhB165]TCM21499.1 hypothetical protein EDF56_101163 [Novosphingobium sp. PhB165]